MKKRSGDSIKNSEILFFFPIKIKQTPFPSRKVINSLFKCFICVPCFQEDAAFFDDSNRSSLGRNL